jgi:hypothetical protein
MGFNWLRSLEFTGNGLNLLLGDWLLFAPMPWIIECMARRADLVQVVWTIGLGLAVAIPYILTSRFQQVRDGVAKFSGGVGVILSWCFAPGIGTLPLFCKPAVGMLEWRIQRWTASLY